MYLGDGHIAKLRRTYALRIYLDAAYPAVIDRCAVTMRAVRPAGTVGVYRHGTNCRIVSSCWWAWPLVFPQHGPGRKHLRPIVLADCQSALVRRHAWQFLRGCLESDGDFAHRVVNGKDYPFYEFSNKSGDILGLFEWACGELGLHWTRPNQDTISIARRRDVDLIARTLTDDALSPDPKAWPSPIARLLPAADPQDVGR